MAAWLLTELEHLVIPVECPGCGHRDVRLCARCGSWLAGPLVRVEQQVPRLETYDANVPTIPVWALGEYLGPARGLVVSWKDRGREDLTKIFTTALVNGLAAFRSDHLFPRVDLVIPMPSSSSSLRQRGRDHLQPLAAAVAKTLSAKPLRLLAKRATRDQVGLSARARGQARIGLRWSAKLRYQTRRHKLGQLWWPTSNCRRVLLLDDVVTTGATLAAARDTLVSYGFDVVGALVLAATPPQTGKTGEQKVAGWVPPPRNGENVLTTY